MNRRVRLGRWPAIGTGCAAVALLAAAVACAAPDRIRYELNAPVITVEDFASDVATGNRVRSWFPAPGPILALVWGWRERLLVHVPADLVETARASASVTRVRDGARVSGDVRVAWVDIAGSEIAPGGRVDVADALSFVPDVPFDAGWHVFRVDLSTWRAAGVLHPYFAMEQDRNDVYYARFRVDRAPTWYATQLALDETYRVSFRPMLSEEVDLEAARFDVRYDGALATGCIGPGVACDLPRPGVIVTLELDSPDVVDLEGNHSVIVQSFEYPPAAWLVYLDADFGIAAADAASP